MDTSTNESFAYMKVFDLSGQNITIGPNTTLSYWIYPESSAATNAVYGSNSTCMAVDAYFTDGSDIRDSGAKDQHGNSLHPTAQCGHLILDQWNNVISNLGAVLNGKTFSFLQVGYDQSGHMGGYRGYIDDITITNPGASTSSFATDFENGSPQPTWTNTPTAPGAVQNVGGLCCGLTGPEMGTRQKMTDPQFPRNVPPHV